MSKVTLKKFLKNQNSYCRPLKISGYLDCCQRSLSLEMESWGFPSFPMFDSIWPHMGSVSCIIILFISRGKISIIVGKSIREVHNYELEKILWPPLPSKKSLIFKKSTFLFDQYMMSGTEKINSVLFSILGFGFGTITLDGFRLARFIQDGDAIDCFGPMYILQLILRIILVFSETLFMTKNHKVGIHSSSLNKFFSGNIEKFKHQRNNACHQGVHFEIKKILYFIC